MNIKEIEPVMRYTDCDIVDGLAKRHKSFVPATAYDALLDELKKREWVPVKKRKPKYGDYVLVWNGRFVDKTYMVDGEWVADRQKHGITHWMPLPSAPEATV